jgi:hypothetical protein
MEKKLAVPEFGVGESITRTKLNNLIKAINAVEDGNNLQVYLKNRSGGFNSRDDLIGIQAVRIDVYDPTGDSWVTNDTPWPKPFTTTPVATVTMFSNGASVVVPYFVDLGATKFDLRVNKINPQYGWPQTLHANVIGIGPIANI